jgi:hypothetical protein
MKLALVTAAFAAPSLAKNFGKITVADSTGDSPVNRDVYVVGADWSSANVDVHADGTGFDLNKGGRIYFAEEAFDTFEGNQHKFWQVNLKDHHFSYEINVSNVGCHCNAAAYFIGMPGNNIGDSGDYYCDANHGNNQWCPEHDTYEGNKHTFATTLHTCDGDKSANNWW